MISNKTCEILKWIVDGDDDCDDNDDKDGEDNNDSDNDNGNDTFIK